MDDTTDMDLLRQYADGNSDPAFAALVARHVNLVYSAALRKTGHPAAAEEITQVVFILLAQKAGRIPRQTTLAGWLYQTARLTAASFLKREARRVRREQEACMQTELHTDGRDETWAQLAPLLEDAMGYLNEAERAAILRRFFGGKSFTEVGTASGVTENAAKQRVTRALEKLHHYFSWQGISSTTAMIAGAISANSVQAAPAGLAKSVAVVAAAKGAAAGGSTLTLIQGALKIMAWTKVKTAVVVGAVVLLAAGTTPMVIHHYQSPSPGMSDDQRIYFTKIQDLSSKEEAYYTRLTGIPPETVARTILEACIREDWTEFAKYWPIRNTHPRLAALDDQQKQAFTDYYSGVQLISLGKPFIAWKKPNNAKYGGVFVPYILRLKNGALKTWQLALKTTDPGDNWYCDGGM